jgi:ribosomal 50S subunit-recycling heat shock protein
MRLDKFLKTTGIIRRRTAAKDIADAGRIEVDGRPAKPASEVRVGQRVTLNLGRKVATYEVLCVPERAVRKEERDQLVRLIEERIDPNW